MSSYNRIALLGRLTSDPEQRFTPNGKAVTSFTLAVDRPKRKDADKETDFVSIVSWGSLAETCAKYLTKGKMCLVEGRLQVRSYEKDGQKRKVYEVVASDVRFIGNGAGSHNTPAQEDIGLQDIGMDEDQTPF